MAPRNSLTPLDCDVSPYFPTVSGYHFVVWIRVRNSVNFFHLLVFVTRGNAQERERRTPQPLACPRRIALATRDGCRCVDE